MWTDNILIIIWRQTLHPPTFNTKRRYHSLMISVNAVTDCYQPAITHVWTIRFVKGWCRTKFKVEKFFRTRWKKSFSFCFFFSDWYKTWVLSLCTILISLLRHISFFRWLTSFFHPNSSFPSPLLSSLVLASKLIFIFVIFSYLQL